MFSVDTEYRRSFTVRSGPDYNAELLTINKHDLFRMKIEFRENFNEFFQGGINELEKTF